MRTLAILLITLQAHCQCLELDLFLVGDFSGSVQGHETFVLDAFDAIVEDLMIGEQNVQVGIVLFNDDPPLLASELNPDKGNLRKRINILRNRRAGGGTHIAPALRMVGSEIMKSNRMVRRLVIIVTDGDSSDVPESLLAAKELELLGIGICGVMINDSSSRPDFMRQLAGGCYVETNYQQLADELRKMDLCL